MQLSANSAIKFGILAGMLAMFFDASIGHGLFWLNDPYWTYWITDASLIAMIVSLGSSFMGIGIWQGAVLIAIQALILEFYYDFLAPIGLPQQPYWLSDYDVWITGYPVHFLVYMSGYLLALWIWRRKVHMKRIMAELRPSRVALFALVTALVILLLDGLITQLFLLGENPGLTFFIQRLIVAFIFLFVWFSYVGLDVKGYISGALLLSLVWLTYNMYLGPVGLPDKFPTYPGYHELWFIIFPGALIASMIGLGITKRLMPMEDKVS
ncbi:hypothetical protein [Sediminibacillus massiliensis]|uniref:hypothetical protein n=1 Tax=Sediminibacillus massiliensis TaxID=1926277 RepID=UPI00117807DE|nr:hypothetical protein [Sediminibacillus massiliensis]